jgi:multidrug efflux pump subunit AcrB
MGIVRFALRYQHTFYVLALLMVFLGGSAIIATPKDIFPSINTPVVTVIWQYTGLTPEEMDQRVTTYSEYAISTSVGNVRNIESQTLSGISVEKIFFQPNVNVDLAISQIGIVTLTFAGRPEVGADPAVHVMRHFARTLPGARH